MPETFSPDYIAQLLSVGGIARANGHSRMAVYKAIARLNIKPVIELPWRLYPPDLAATLKEKMRPVRKEAR